MYNDIDVAWFAGLFEGEGTFKIEKESYAGGLAIQMTDLDVLEKVQSIFGGKVTQSYDRKDKPHWKTCYKWSCSVSESDVIVPLLLPYLGARRKIRANLYLELRSRTLAKQKPAQLKRQQIVEAIKTGLTQREVAKFCNVSQPYVNKVINNIQ